MSWESTALYYRLVNEAVRDRAGGMHSAPLVVWSVDFAEIEALQRTGEWEKAGRLLAQAGLRLERAGVGAVALCTNTMHVVAEQIRADLTVPFLHVLDAVAAEAARLGCHRVGLLGTGYTMDSPLYPEGLATRGGIEVAVPPAADRQLVHDVIYDELVLGVVREQSAAEYRRVIAGLAEAGADAVILGCTEITMLVGADDSPVPLFDSTALHAAAIADAVLGPDPDRGPLDGVLLAAPAATEGGQVDSRTTFDVIDRGDVVRANYRGGELAEGALIGRRDGATLDWRYVQLDRSGHTNTGHTVDTASRAADGRWTLDETWQWESRSGAGTSVLTELPTRPSEVEITT
jgi:aspartate racemase